MMNSTKEVARRRLAMSTAVLILIGAMAGTASAERPPSAKLLPRTTVALFSVTDVPDLIERFKQTALGRMSRDPQMEPLIGVLYGSLTEALVGAEEQLGLSLPELMRLPNGEITIAVVAPEDAPASAVLLVDVGDEVSKARRLLARFDALLLASGGQRREEYIDGTRFSIYGGLGPRNRPVIFFEKDNTIVLGNDPEVLGGLLYAWNEGSADTLGNSSKYSTMMRLCRTDGNVDPQVTWYVDPLAIIRNASREDLQMRVAAAFLPGLGLDGLAAVGGSITLDVDQYDMVVHAHLGLDSPRYGVLRAIALESDDLEPEPWVPADVASYSTIHWDLKRTYEEAANLYDVVYGEGTLAQLLQSRLLQPIGLDLVTELLPSLDGRMTAVSWVDRKSVLTPSSLWAVKLKDTRAFDKALAHFRSQSRQAIRQRATGGRVYFQVEVPQTDSRPGAMPQAQPCFGLLDDYVLVATNPSIYQKVVSTLAQGTETLADDPEFKLIASRIRRQPGGDTAAMIAFTRPEESLRTLYELVASQENREALGAQVTDSRFFRTLDGALSEHPLPSFDKLRRYMAPGGAMIADDVSGVHYMSFVLQRKTGEGADEGTDEGTDDE